MMVFNRFRLAGLLAAAILSAAACSSGSVGNALSGLSGGTGNARLINASPNTAGPLALVVANATINSGITTATPVGTYASVKAGTQSFLISPTAVPAQSKSIAASTFYTVALVGEPGSPDYGEDIFQDTNSLQNSATVRYKVNDAAPAPGSIDVYVFQGTTMPATPTVAGLTAGTDSGSIPNPPGNSYIPAQGSNVVLPSGTYNIVVTPAGVPSTTLFSGSAALSTGFSYSFTIEDATGGTPSSAQVILAIDQPMQTSNQSNLLTDIRRRI